MEPMKWALKQGETRGREGVKFLGCSPECAISGGCDMLKSVLSPRWCIASSMELKPGRAAAEGSIDFYDVDISLRNLRHHWNVCSRTSAAGVSDVPSVIHSSAACAV